MNLFILRHGIAVDRSTPGYPDDSKRPLTAKGIRRLKEITQAMVQLELTFDLIISSPFLRASQTADVVADELKFQKQLTFSDELTPGGSPKSLIDKINKLRPQPKNLMLVGHEPYLSKLIALLIAGNTDVAIALKKGGLCKLEIEALHYGRCATFAWLLTPRQMELMS